jgi:hypothetical protein
MFNGRLRRPLNGRTHSGAVVRLAPQNNHCTKVSATDKERKSLKSIRMGL